MPSVETLFQTAVKKNSTRDARRAAIETLGEQGATDQLHVIVLTSGLDGVYRREALDALRSCGATEALEAIATNRSVEPGLRESAARTG
jgi:hypothetical protein